MLQTELEERIGRKVTQDEYVAINAMYMSTNLNKDVFCKMFLKNRESLDIIIEEGKKIEKLYKERAKTIDVIFEQANKYSSAELRSCCIEMMGARNYIRKMIETGKNLWQADKDLIVSLL